MDVNPTTSTTGSGLAGQQAQAQESLDETMNNFLMMLTTQLQHQDPLDPLDTAEFTGQLVGFSTVEQLIAANQKLDDLIAAQSLANDDQDLAAQPIDYIGMEVEVIGSGFGYQDSPATLAYHLDTPANLVTVTVLDGLGEPVWETTAAPTSQGRHEVVWDGTKSDGAPAEPGLYYVEARAVDGAGIITQPPTFVSGTVTGVDTSLGLPLLKVGELFVSLDEITAVREPTPPPPPA